MSLTCVYVPRWKGILPKIMIVTVKKLKSFPARSYFAFCNVLYIYGSVRAIPTYRVYRLYNNN